MKSNNGIGIEFNHSYFLFGSVWFDFLLNCCQFRRCFFRKYPTLYVMKLEKLEIPKGLAMGSLKPKMKGIMMKSVENGNGTLC